MKTFKTLLLLLLSVTAMEAKTIQKIANPTYVGINNGKMEIVSVRTTEEATTITFQYPGEGFGHFSPKTHIVDEQGRNYAMIGQKGFSEDSLKRLSPKKKGKYELRFEPLPEETRIFDMIENPDSWKSTKYYGIRGKDMPFTVTNPKKGNEEMTEFPDSLFKKGHVTLTGHIKNYNILNAEFTNVMMSDLHYPNIFTGFKESPKSTIDRDGNFRMELEVYGPTWTYLMFCTDATDLQEFHRTLAFVPIMLCPNDEIDIQINSLDEDVIKETTYNSRKKMDMNNLMHCAPMIFSNAQFVVNATRYQGMTLEAVKKDFEEYDNLARYLSGKYALTHIETEMLRSHFSVIKAIDVIKTVNAYNRSDLIPTERKWKDSDSFFNLALSNVRAESNIFMATPEWMFLFSNRVTTSNQIPLVYKYEKEEKEIKDFQKGRFRLMQEWRAKNGRNDDIFEQAFILCSRRTLIKSSIPIDIYNRFNQIRELFYHPSFIRMAGELLQEEERELFRQADSHHSRWWSL